MLSSIQWSISLLNFRRDESVENTCVVEVAGGNVFHCFYVYHNAKNIGIDKKGVVWQEKMFYREIKLVEALQIPPTGKLTEAFESLLIETYLYVVHLISFLKICYHYNNRDIFLPNHGPEITDGVFFRS